MPIISNAQHNIFKIFTQFEAKRKKFNRNFNTARALAAAIVVVIFGWNVVFNEKFTAKKKGLSVILTNLYE